MRKALRESARQNVIDIVSLALISRDPDGRLELIETRGTSDWNEQSSGPFPAILRLMFGPSGHASATSRLYGLAESLPPRSSAIAALIEHRWVEDVRALMEEAGSDTVEQVLRSEIGAALAEGRDLVLTAGAADWRAVPLERLTAARR